MQVGEFTAVLDKSLTWADNVTAGASASIRKQSMQ